MIGMKCQIQQGKLENQKLPLSFKSKHEKVRTIRFYSSLLFRTRVFQRAIVFFLLNPQPNGAGFAGIWYPFPEPVDLRNFTNLVTKLRAQGKNTWFKVMVNDGQSQEESGNYEQMFEV